MSKLLSIHLASCLALTDTGPRGPNLDSAPGACSCTSPLLSTPHAAVTVSKVNSLSVSIYMKSLEKPPCVSRPG